MRHAILAAVLLAGVAFAAAPRAAFADQPTFKTEEQKHPRLAHAIHQLEEAAHELEHAPDDFGGNKAVALADTRRAIHSLKRALYYRMHLDDAALDAAHP
jgi:hypothetical protein